MRTKVLMTLGATLLMAGSAMADSTSPRIYAVHSKDNFCPAGLQPVTMDGTICCGKPNQSMSYQQMLAHAAPKRHKRVRAARADCPIGEKGCSYN